MAGHQLEKASHVTAPKFSIAGKYARPDEGNFVKHAALIRDECQLLFGSEANVWHTVPPIIAGDVTSIGTNHEHDRCEVHAVSYLEDLTPDEIAGIETVLAEIDSQTQPAESIIAALGQYIVHPPVQWVVDPKTGTKRFRKFSCVGFVFECYDAGANVRLLDIASPNLPPVDIKVLEDAYGEVILNAGIRRRLGIEGEGPWAIALAGYLLNSLARPAEEVRTSEHLPGSIDEAAFPGHCSSDASE